MATSSPLSEQFKFIQFSAEDAIARIVLNHAPYNVLTVPMMTEMAQSIESLNMQSDVKAILVSSSQKTFSAGISLEDSRPHLDESPDETLPQPRTIDVGKILPNIL